MGKYSEEKFLNNAPMGYTHKRKRERIKAKEIHDLRLLNFMQQHLHNVTFVDLSENSVRVIVPVSIWTDSSISLTQKDRYHDICRGRIIGLENNVVDGVFLVSPELKLN